MNETTPPFMVDADGRPLAAIVGYGIILLEPTYQGGTATIIETAMSPAGLLWYREHYGGFSPFNAWVEATPVPV